MSTKSKSGSMKGFFRQQKPTTGISKKRKTKSPEAAAATLGSGVTQPAALISHGSPDLNDDYDEQEQLLRQFDMNPAYGPCVGMARLARWERACNMGMNPPKEVESLLKGGKVRLECCWHGRI